MSTEGTSEDFPASWINALIGDAAEFVRGVTYQKSDARNQAEDGYIPLIRATNIGNETLTYDEFVFVPRNVVKSEQLIRVNDIVIAASSGSISVVGKSAPVLRDFEATFGAFCAVLRPKDEVLPGFFRLYVQSPTVRETWSNLARGTNINNLKREQVLSTSMPIAPLPEQEKIVEILDEQLSRLDAALTSVRAVRKKTARFRRSLLHAAFTGALTGHDNSTNNLPTDWKISSLGDVAKWGSGGTPKSGTSSFYGGPIKWAVIGDLTESWVSETAQSITKLGLEKSSAKVVSPGTVMLAMYGASIGRTGIASTEMATNQAIAFAVPHDGILDAQYLLKYLQSQKEDFVRAGQGGAQPNISQTVIKPWPIPLPPIEEQMRIIELLEEQLSRLDASLAIADAIEKKASALRRSLLHAAFSGNLTKEWREGAHV